MGRLSDLYNELSQQQAEAESQYIRTTTPGRVAPTPKSEPVQQEQEEEPGLLSDAWSSFGIGAGQLVKGAEWLFGTDTTIGQDTVDYWQNQLSDAQAEANEQRFVDEDMSLGEGFSNPRTWMGTIVQSLPMMVPGIGAAGGAARLGLKAGMSKAGAAAAGATAGSTMEGATIGALVGEEVEEVILNAPIEELQNSPYFQDLIEAGKGEDEARQMVAEKASEGSGLKAGVVGAVLGVAFNKFVGDAVTGRLSERLLKETGKGAAEGAGTEAAQTGVESYAKQTALNENLGRPYDLSEAANEMVGGTGAGGVMGGAVGFGGGLAGSNTPEQTTPTNEEPPAPQPAPEQPVQAEQPTQPAGPDEPAFDDGLDNIGQRMTEAENAPVSIRNRGRNLAAAPEAPRPLSEQVGTDINTEGLQVVYQQDGITVEQEGDQFRAYNEDGLEALGRDAADARRKLTRQIERNWPKGPILQNRDRNTPAYIAQMREIAQNPKYNRVSTSREPTTGAPMAFPRGVAPEVPAMNLGRKDTVTMSDGKGGEREVPVQYAVVEADQVQASHRADGKENAGYTQDGLIALNNGRTAGLQAAFEQGTTDPYIEAMLADDMHGIDPAAIRSKQRPMLIRLFDGQSLEGIDNPGDASNTSPMADLSLSEQAKTDAGKLDNAILSEIQPGDPTGSNNTDFVARAVDAIGKGDTDTVMRDREGLLTSAGQRRIRGALIARAYSDDTLTQELVEATDSDLKTLGDALTEVAGRWALMREQARDNAINPDMDVTDALVSAVNMIRKSRQEGRSLKDIAGQIDAFAGEADQMAVYMLSLFYRGASFNRIRSKDAIADALSNYIESALQSSPGVDMFGEQTQPQEVLSREAEQAEGSTEAAQEPARRVQPDGPDNRESGPEAEGRGRDNRRAEDAEGGQKQQKPGSVETKNENRSAKKSPKEAGNEDAKKTSKQDSRQNPAPKKSKTQRESPTISGEMYSKDGYRRSPESRIESLSAEQATSIAVSLMRDWKGRPPVTIAEQIGELPMMLQAAIRMAGAENDMRAVFWNDHVYILAPRIPNRAALEEVILHEVVGHYGLRKMIGGNLKPLLDRVYRDMGDTPMAQNIKHIYFGNQFDPTKSEHRLTVAEELLAHLAESGKQRHRNLWQRIVTAIREGLRRIGFTIRMKESDLLGILSAAQEAVVNGATIRAAEVTAAYSQKPNDEAMFSRAGNRLDAAATHFSDLTEEQRTALGKIAPRTPQERAQDWLRERTDRWQTKVRQGAVDRFAALADVDMAVHGRDVVENSTASSSWVLAQMSGAASGALQSMLTAGRIKLNQREKVLTLQDGTRGLNDTLKQLGSAAEIERFFGWIAGNRSRRLMAEGRENLFEPQEVEALANLNRGTTDSGQSRFTLYDSVFREFQQYRDDVLAIAEQSGIITPEQRETWANEFYVPFYRLAEDDGSFTGPKTSGGISRQEAYKKLKGGSRPLNDLLENTMMNFHHLLQASLKNQAAMQAMDNSQEMGIAREVREADRDTQNSTFILRDGQKIWYEIDDPLVFKAVTALAHPGMNSTAMKIMRSFKRIFTNLTTTTPQFVIANLLRDSMQAAATSEVSKNVLRNMAQGSKAYGDPKIRAKMLASGGSFSFGHLYGENADELRLRITGGLAQADILRNPSMIPDAVGGMWRKWNEMTEFTENINRAAIFEQNQDRGELYAAFKARDLMNFSQHGAWPAMRVLIDVVPFLNARLQGLDKIYRSGVKPGLRTAMGQGTANEKQAAMRFWSVTGTLALATVALYLNNRDDEEYQKLEEWQKDTYWFFRLSDDHAIFIPKPFEVGAIATLAERLTEQAVSDTATGKLFADRLSHMLLDTFSFSPIPQMAQPMLDVYANYDAFTGRPIESMGMERLSPSLRRRTNTTSLATGISSLTESVFGSDGTLTFSPVEIDHMIQGYFGSVGAWAAGVADTIWRTAQGETSPSQYWYEYQPIRRFYKNLGNEDRYTRYGTVFYEALKETNRVYSDIREYVKLGDMESARSLYLQNQQKMAYRIALNRVQRNLSDINKAMDRVRKMTASSEYKRREMDRLRAIKNRMQEAVGKRLEQAEAS